MGCVAQVVYSGLAGTAAIPRNIHLLSRNCARVNELPIHIGPLLNVRTQRSGTRGRAAFCSVALLLFECC